MTVDDQRTAPVRRGRVARALTSASRVTLLQALQDEGPSTTAALAARTGLHENTVREHLQRLVEADLVVRETERRTTRGRPRTVYRATASAGARTDAGAPRHRAEAVARARLTSVLLRGYGASVSDVTASARAAGRALSDDLPRLPEPPDDQLAALEGHFERLGFEPVVDLDRGTVDLWRCPFLELARERPEVVCHVHLGLADAVLELVDGPVRAERLVPFVGPRHCRLHLSGVATAAGPPTRPVPPTLRTVRCATTEGEP